jgi:hypothetical protein
MRQQGIRNGMKEIRLLSTSAILGYGFPEASLQAGLARNPHIIGVDGGSVDPGPHYLGAGVPFCSTMAIKRDLRLMLRAAIGAGIPLIKSLRVAREVISNSELVHHLVQVEEDVRGGAGLGVALAKSKRFPVLLHQLVTVGEETGRTGIILKKLAKNVSDNAIKRCANAPT